MRHLLVQPGAFQVATWREAFPSGVELVIKDLQPILDQGGKFLIWLRVSGQEGGATVENVRCRTSAPIVVLSDEPSDAMAAACLRAGASGYCNTHAAPSVLHQVASVVAEGGIWLGQGLLQRLMGGVATLLQQHATTRPTVDLKDYGLTDREFEVVQRVATGASNREIAEQLQVTERTVKAHLSAAFSKLGVRDRLQLSLRFNGLLG